MSKIGNVSDHYDTYTNIRFKSYDQGVMWMEEDPHLLSIGFGYDEDEIAQTIDTLNRQVDDMAGVLRASYGSRMDQLLTGKSFKFAIIGCSFSSEYLSYFNVVERLLEPYEGIQVIDAGVTAETVPQTVEHIYNRVLKYKPDISSLYMGINDMRRNGDVYTKNNVSPREFYRDMDYLIHALKHCGSEVILHTLTPCNILAQERGVIDKRWTYRIDDWDIYNGIVKELADVNNCPLNDQMKNLESFDGEVNIPENGLHLTWQAQQFLAAHFLEVFLDTVSNKFGEA